MLITSCSVYQSGENDAGFSDYIGGERFFCTLEIDEGYDKTKGDELLREISQTFVEKRIDHIHEFEEILADLIQKANVPLSFSFSSGYLNEDVFFLKTFGNGAVFLKRGREFKQIISGDKSATGYAKHGDIFMFSSRAFLERAGDRIDLRSSILEKSPSEIVKTLTLLGEQIPQNTITLFISFEEKKEKAENNQILRNLFTSWQLYSNRIGQKKILTFVAVIIIALIFLWSVVLGFQRRNAAQEEKKIQFAREFITQKLDQSEEVSFLNLPRAQVLIGEAKEEFRKLESIKNVMRNKQYQELAKLINDKENKILKKEEKKYEEFFDLTADEKDARGKKLSLDGENVAILDETRGIVYLLSLTKKSFDKQSFTEIKNAELLALYKDTVFVFKNSEGIYKSGKDGKLKKIIEKDLEWGRITDMAVYNGNIYLLDNEKDQVYKYLAAEDGYSNKTSYFKAGEGANLKDSQTMAIDSSVYIAFPDFIIKYGGGVRDEFKTTYPGEDVHINKILTNRELEKVYAWNRQKGAVYVLGKNGSYERQIQSSIFQKGNDIVVFDNNAYVLLGSKLYKVSLD